MRLCFILAGTVILTIFLCYPTINNSLKVGCATLFKLSDSFFNEIKSENDGKKNSIYSKTEDEKIDSNVITCNSWSSLNDLFDNHIERVIDTSKIVNETPIILFDNLQKDLQIFNAMVENYNTRLGTFHPLEHRSELDKILITVNTINKGFQYILGDAIEKIDHDIFESHKLSRAHIKRTLEQFKKIIQIRNEARLECTCDVAKLLLGVIEKFATSTYMCGNVTNELFSNYIKKTILHMANSIESIALAFGRAEKCSKSSIELTYILPKKVGINVFWYDYY